MHELRQHGIQVSDGAQLRAAATQNASKRLSTCVCYHIKEMGGPPGGGRGDLKLVPSGAEVD